MYYNTRDAEGKVYEDSGASLRDTVKVIQKLGVCREEFWPYACYQTAFMRKPPQVCYDAAKGNTVSVYEKLEDPTDIRQIRASLDQNYPIVFGFKIFKQSFEIQATWSRGNMEMPGYYPDEPVGNHAVVAVGYNDVTKRVTVLNSWGHDWGDNGYFYMPYDFITNKNYCFDFWKIEFASETV